MEKNPGILPYQLGVAKVKSRFHTFLHYYDLNPVQTEISNLKDLYENVTEAIKTGLSNPYYAQLINFDRVLRYQITAAEQKLHSLLLPNRAKRGIINGLGHVIKIISGNMDAEDAVHYDEAISELQNNQKLIVGNLNKQISLTTDIIQNFNQTVSLIKTNQEIVHSEINEIRTKLNKFMFDFTDYLRTRNVLDQISTSFTIILHLLDEVENAVAFARLGILHNSVIKINEMRSILRTITQYHSLNELIFANINDAHRYYDVLEINAYYSGSKIVFAMHFPIVYPESFPYYHLYSIPTLNSSTIIPKNSFLIMSEEFYQYASSPCIDLKTVFYCPYDDLTSHEEHEDCVFQLLQLKANSTNCQRTPITIKDNVMEQVDEAHYIAIFIRPTKVQTICRKTDFTTLHGNYLVYLPYGCKILIGLRTYINEKTTSVGQALLLPEVKIPYSHTESEIPNIILDDIQLDRLHEIQKKQSQMKPIILHHSQHPANSFWNWLFYIVLVVVGIGIGLRHLFKKLSLKRRSGPQTQEAGSEERTPNPQAFFTS